MDIEYLRVQIEKAENAIKNIKSMLDSDDVFPTVSVIDPATIPQFELLSSVTYLTYQHQIKKTKEWWWLKSPGNLSIYTAAVNPDGTIDSNGNNVYLYGGVRPCFKMPGLCPVGVSVLVGRIPFSNIGGDIMLSDFVLYKEKFSDDFSNWETSIAKNTLTDKTVRCCQTGMHID